MTDIPDIQTTEAPPPANERLALENARMKQALRSIRRYAEDAAFGRWRFVVADLVDEGLQQ